MWDLLFTIIEKHYHVSDFIVTRDKKILCIISFRNHFFAEAFIYSTPRDIVKFFNYTGITMDEVKLYETPYEFAGLEIYSLSS